MKLNKKQESKMASTSPGGGPGSPSHPPDQPATSSFSSSTTKKTVETGVNEKVGFFEQVWKNRPRSRSLGRKSKKDSLTGSAGLAGIGSSSRSSRVETAYHGPR